MHTFTDVSGPATLENLRSSGSSIFRNTLGISRICKFIRRSKLDHRGLRAQSNITMPSEGHARVGIPSICLGRQTSCKQP